MRFGLEIMRRGEGNVDQMTRARQILERQEPWSVSSMTSSSEAARRVFARIGRAVKFGTAGGKFGQRTPHSIAISQNGGCQRAQSVSRRNR